MKAMLLAAGRGERMRPLTLERPKPLLEVRGAALIDRHLVALVAAGIEEIVVNVSWLGEQIIAHCGDGSRYGARITYSREARPLETAGGIVQALSFLGRETFLLVNADVFTDYPLGALRGRAGGLGPAAARLVLVDNPAHNPAGDFSLQGERVLRAASETLTYAGIGLYEPRFFADCAAGVRPLRPLLERAIDRERLFGEHYHGAWTDVGTPERLQQLNQPQAKE